MTPLSSKANLMPQFVQQFFRAYPWTFPVLIFSMSLIQSRWFSPWAQLAKTYRHPAKFVGQTWKWQSVAIGRNSKGQAVTIGMNIEGLYLRSSLSLILVHQPLLIPWAELEVEREQRWIGTVYHLRSAAQHQIKITITDTLFKKLVSEARNNFAFNQTIKLVLGEESYRKERLPLISEKSVISEKLVIKGKLLAQLFAITFAIGLGVGLINHGVAIFQSFQHPAQYQVYAAGKYESLRDGKEWTHLDMEFLGLSQAVYVKVEKQRGETVAETFYSIFGSSTTIEYVAGQWTSQKSGLFSAPLYMINCVLPLMLGFLGIGLLLSVFGQRKVSEQDSLLVQRFNKIGVITSLLWD
jgi:hypothetical protein